MSAQLIDGKAQAETVLTDVAHRAAALKADTGAVPGLAVVLVGSDPASQVYVASKGKRAQACGFHSVQRDFPEDTSQETLLSEIAALNADPAIHGILVQLPLPSHLDERTIIAAVSPEKDVDGLHDINIGRLASGQMERAFVPCTPLGCMRLLETVHPDGLAGAEAVVVGRSNLVGRPIASLLQHANATVTVTHSRTRDLPSVCRRADILVAAIGRPGFIKGGWIKSGATVIDVGINRISAPEKGEGKTRLVGDVDFAAASEVAGAITPVPGGVGPMTIAMLMANTLTAAERAAR